MKYFLVLFSFGFLFLSCSSSDDTDSNNTNNDQEIPEEKLLLKKVFIGGVLDEQYEYFSDNKLKKANGYIDPVPVEIRYEYVLDTIIETFYVENEPRATQKNYIVNEFISRSDYFDDINGLYNFRIFGFENNNCGVMFSENYDTQGVIQQRVNYNYYDENCSFEANFEYSGLSNGHQINDNKHSYNESTKSSILRRENYNNALEKRVWDLNNELISSYSYNSVFEYNDKDYPIKETRSYIDGNVIVYTYEYY